MWLDVQDRTSFFPFLNPKKPLKVLVEDDDLAGDVIRRVCMVANTSPEPRMYLRLEDGTEMAAGDMCSNFIR